MKENRRDGLARERARLSERKKALEKRLEKIEMASRAEDDRLMEVLLRKDSVILGRKGGYHVFCDNMVYIVSEDSDVLYLKDSMTFSEYTDMVS